MSQSLLSVAAGALVIALALTSPVQALDIMCMDFRPLLGDRQIERPSPPDCADSYGSFSDEYEFNQCRSEMTEYQRKLQAYGDCLASENKEAVREFNSTVEKFNSRASR